MKFTIVIVRPPGYRFSDCFREVAETVMYGLRELGYEAEITENTFRPNTKHIIFGAHMVSADSSFPPDSVLYNLEQVDGGNIGNLRILGGKYTIWDYAKPNCDAWAKFRIQAVHVPIGYVPEMTRIPSSEQDIDVLFYGSLNDRRKTVLNELHKSGLNLVVRVNDCYGSELDNLMARAKVILNVHYYESKIFEIVRVGYALANKKCVVSEQSVDEYPTLVNGLCVCDYDDIAGYCISLLKTPSHIDYMAHEGFRAFSATKESDFLERAGIPSLVNA